VELLPHSYTNHTTREGSVVTKSYQGPDASRRCAREAAALSALAGRLPVPPVIGRSDTILRLGFMPGVPGQELIDDGLAGPVLRACGQLLRRIHAIDPAELDLLSRHEDSAVLVHGDYGPQNILLDAAAAEVLAVVDWEWVHGAGPVEDVACWRSASGRNWIRRRSSGRGGRRGGTGARRTGGRTREPGRVTLGGWLEQLQAERAARRGPGWPGR
jgi:hypothetical protein